MDKYFSLAFKGGAFITFSFTHIATLIVLTALNFFLIRWFIKLKQNSSTSQWFRYSMAWLLILLEASYTVWSICTGDFSPAYSLPLHLCDAAALLSALMLLRKNYFLFEIAYFWGIGGSLQALITPDMGPYSFPHFIYFNFFLTHGLIITVILYAVIVEGFRPSMQSVAKAFIFTNVYAAFIALVNVLTHGNYLFICKKPASPSIMDLLGPWPWYIGSLEFMAVAIFVICYLPFAFRNITSKSKYNHTSRV